jgi:glucosidase
VSNSLQSIPFDLESFPDLLPLRSASGQATGLFSDHGAWLGIIWGVDCLLEIRDLRVGYSQPFDLGSPLRKAESWPDHQAATLLDGTELRIAFAPNGNLVIEVRAAIAPQPQCPLPHKIVPQSGGIWWIVISEAAAAEQIQSPAADLFEQNRARWNQWFRTAQVGMAHPDDPAAQKLMARAITTLMWNSRAPQTDLPHAGVIPSPFSYCGYWAWDSWKHAHAMAQFAPEIAAEQLRAQFCRQRDDGMVGDTVMPDPADDNWSNSKPPLAAWALYAIWQKTGDSDLLTELYPKCAAQLRWWKRNRQIEGEALYRAGGVDHLTATWDTGWDLSHRFEGIDLQAHRSWKLLDLWQPDLNAYILNDLGAMAAMAEAAGDDAKPWRDQAEQLADAIKRGLWNEARGCFCDVRASDGISLGIRSAASWLPLWAGAADEFQTQRTLQTMQSPSHFGTPMPFPTLAASDSQFDPDGYWNGGVWVDHAAYAHYLLGQHSRNPSGTDRSDRVEQPGDPGHPGELLRDRLLDELSTKDSLYECYSPLDGQPAHGRRPAVAQFSWTAAAVLEMLTGGPHPSLP